MAIPKSMQGKYDEISALLIQYCDKYLDEEYKELTLYALEKLCRKRPSPLSSGKAMTWAAGIVYAIGANNFIFDKSQPIHYIAKELMEPFGLSSSTGGKKAAQIKILLKIDQTKSEWILKSMIIHNPMVWYVMVNGYMVDARRLPVELQEICYEKGLIPFIPGDMK